MRQITSWLLFIAFIGVTVTLLTQKCPPSVTQKPEIPSSILNNEIVSPDLPILAYCELINNPEKYSGKIVRIKAQLSGFQHGILFVDRNCTGIDKQTAVTFNLQNKEESEHILNKARGTDNWLIPLDLVVIGRFRKVVPSNSSDTIYHTASLQFEITHVENAFRLD